VRVTTPAARTAELHEMFMSEDAMMSMRQVEAFEIAPHSRLRLAPGGRHLMLIDLSRDLQAGQTLPLTLAFSDGTTRNVTATVRGEVAATATPVAGGVRTTTVENEALGGPFTLVDHHGREFRSSTLRGTPSLLFFGYTHCPDACPTILSRIARAYREAGPDARAIPTLFVSVDPRDTPPVLAQYLRYFTAVPATGLTGTKEQIDAVVRQFGARYEIRDTGSAAGPLVDHTLHLYLLGPDGMVNRRFNPDADPKEIAGAMTDMLSR
jgi:protein SCO1/2